MGARTTLENELKISNTEALNYLMGFPLNFNLEPFMRLFYTQFGSLNDEELEYIDILKFDFDKKKKLIKQNFESTTHIDVKDFEAWVKIKKFITLK
jgi:hypothetical protein